MVKKALIPIDGSELSIRVLKYAKKLMVLKIIQRATIIHVHPKIGDGRGSAIERRLQIFSDAEAKKLLSDAQVFFEQEDLPVDTDVLIGDPADEILKYAIEHNYDVIVMGNQGLSTLGQLILGDTFSKTARLSSVPIITIGKFTQVE